MDHEGVFLADVSCRIFATYTPLRGLRDLDPHQGSALDLLGAQSAPRSPAAGRSLHVVPPHNIDTLCDLQTTDSGKSISILMRKLGGNGWKLLKTQGKLRESDLENSVRTLLKCAITQSTES